MNCVLQPLYAIILGCSLLFYQLISFHEKLFTSLWCLTFALNVILNLSTIIILDTANMMITNISNRILLCVELGAGWHPTQSLSFKTTLRIVQSVRMLHFYRKTEFAECIGKQELSFINLPTEFSMFVSLWGDLYSFIILRLNRGFKLQ